jgi:tRNA pseudouridine55 synthase
MPAARTDGFLLVDKPRGLTSQGAVTGVRRALGASRAGHTGTLDPEATGLLVILVGSATRLARFVPTSDKVYEAEIRFGFETDTDDAVGTPTVSAPLPDDQAVYQAIPRLTGRIRQVPPSFSAKHVEGRRAYAMARAGQVVTLESADVDVRSWDVLAHQGERWRVRIACGAGTYVRALARDLGRYAGSAAHLAALRRTRIGPFGLEDAIPLDQVHEGIELEPPLEVLVGMPRVVVSGEAADRIRRGGIIDAPDSLADDSAGFAALVDEHGDLLAVAERSQGSWQPRVVLAHA